MTNSIKSRLVVIGLLLSVAVGAPVASILGNAPRRAAATAQTSEVAEPTVYEMPEETIRATMTIPVVDVVGTPVRTARGKKDAGEERAVRSCRRVSLEQQGIGYDSSVKMCDG